MARCAPRGRRVRSAAVRGARNSTVVTRAARVVAAQNIVLALMQMDLPRQTISTSERALLGPASAV
eukprot:2797266-Prymnesium_polylepis.1